MNKFKVGDRIKIVKKVVIDRIGWSDNMDDYIGQEGEIIQCRTNGGYALEDSKWWIWPEESLELVPDTYEKSLKVANEYIKNHPEAKKKRKVYLRRVALGTHKSCFGCYYAGHDKCIVHSCAAEYNEIYKRVYPAQYWKERREEIHKIIKNEIGLDLYGKLPVIYHIVNAIIKQEKIMMEEK